MAKTLDLAAEIVAAYVVRNAVPIRELPGLLRQVSGTLDRLAAPLVPAAEARPSIEQTVTAEYIISLEDGKPYKTLKGHLTARGLTPAEYRLKWNLPADYPMVCARYSAKRSEITRARHRRDARRASRKAA